MTIRIPSDHTNPLKIPLETHSVSIAPAKTKKLIEGKQAIPAPVHGPASEVNMQKHTLDKLNQYSTPQIVATLKKEKAGVGKLVDIASTLSQDQLVLTKQVIDRISAGVIEKIIREGMSSHGTSVEAPVAVYKKEMDLSQVMQPLEIEEGFIRELPELELAVVGTNILSRGSVIFTSGMLLNKIEEAIEAKKQYKDSLVDETKKNAVEQEITILKKWVNVRLSIMSSSMTDLALNVAMSSPKALSAIVAVAKATGSVVSSVIDWVGLGVGLVGAALSFHFSRINFKTHDAWTTLIGINGEGEVFEDFSKLEVNPDQLKVKGEFDVQIKVPTHRKVNVDAIIERQKKVFAARFQANHLDLAKRLKAVLPDLEVASFSNENWQPGDEILGKLREAGIELSEIHDAVKDLKKKEMLSVSLRKGLLAFNQKKDQIDKGFLQQDINKTGGLLALSSILTGAVIVLKALLIAGVIASTVALSAVGYGMLAAVIGTMIFGAVYLYIKKPNIFKTYVKGVQAQLLFWSIPRAIQNFRSHYAQLDEMRVSDQINDIRGRVLEAERLLFGTKKDSKSILDKHLFRNKTAGLNVESILEKYVKKLKKSEVAKLKEAEWLNQKISELNESITNLVAKLKEAESIKQKVSELNESITYLEAKLKPLQEQVAIAGWKDFQLSLKRKEGELKVEVIKKEGELNVEEKKYVTVAKTKDSKDDAAILAEYLVQDIGLEEDSQTRKLLLHMDINPNTLSKQDAELLKVMVAERLRAFFAMETSETMGMINKQNLLEKHGLRKNIADS